MGVKKSKWYSFNRLLSYNAMYYFVMSNRGNGKSYASKRLIIDTYLKKGKQACYVRRTKSELTKTVKTFWNDIKKEYPDLEFDVKGDIGYINGEEVVYFMAFSVAGKLRSSSYPDVGLVIYDEYIIETSRFNNYLPFEENLVWSLNETIIRDREDVRVIFIGNCVSFVNPIFTDLGIEPTPGKQFQKFLGGLVVLEHLNDTSFAEEKRKTKHARLMLHSKYGQYAIDNIMLEDTADFIAKGRGKGNWGYTTILKSQGFAIGVWTEHLTNTYYIDKDVKLNSDVPRYTVLNKDTESGYKNLKIGRDKDWRIKDLKKAYYEGKVYYNNQEVKKFFINNVAPYL